MGRVVLDEGRCERGVVMGGVRVAIAGMAAVAVALVGVPASTAQEGPLASACADAPQGRFLDVSGVHEAGIDCIGWWGVTQGTGDGTYLPGEPVNRAQMATFVARAIELSGGTLPEAPPAAFEDTDGNVHAPAIDALAALEVVGGVGDGLYAPDRVVTRGQMAAFLAGAWEARTGEELAPGDTAFADIEGNVHAAAIAAITAVGWTGGTAPGVYEPGLPVTRAQMGTFLARWLTTLVEEGHADYPPANPVPIPERPEPQPEPDPEPEPSPGPSDDPSNVDADGKRLPDGMVLPEAYGLTYSCSWTSSGTLHFEFAILLRGGKQYQFAAHEASREGSFQWRYWSAARDAKQVTGDALDLEPDGRRSLVLPPGDRLRFLHTYGSPSQIDQSVDYWLDLAPARTTIDYDRLTCSGIDPR